MEAELYSSFKGAERKFTMEECSHPRYVAIGHWDGKAIGTGKKISGHIIMCIFCRQETYLSEQFDQVGVDVLGFGVDVLGYVLGEIRQVSGAK